LDVGCHIGSFWSAAKRIFPQGEASPTKASWLTSKFPTARIEQVAISNQSGTAIFEENLKNSGFSKLAGSSRSAQSNFYEVRTATIDEFNFGPVDLLKLDIEGAELAALQRAERFLKTNQPTIIFECGADEHERRAIFDLLTEKYGYAIFTYADFLYGKGHLSLDEFRKCNIYPFRAFNYLAVPSRV
jgi:FkbM family methyltransferase